MHNLKESRLYLRFLKTFWWIFVVAGLIGMVGGVGVVRGKKPLYVTERFFEFPYALDNSPQVEKQASEVVSVLRSPQLKEKLEMNNSEVVVFKPSPYALTLRVKSVIPEESVNNLTKLSSYLSQNYQVQEIGKAVFSVETPPFWRFGLFGLFDGLGIGFIITLVISYFKNY